MDRIEQLVALVEQSFDAPAWHGPNLWNAVRGVDLERAAWRPAPNRHNVWEEVVHAAYWKYRAWRDLTRASGGEAQGFGVKGSDWFARPDGAPSEAAWRDDLRFLRDWHARLLEAVRAFPEARLDEQVRASRWTYAGAVMGAASHDVYHAGQIRLLLRLQGEQDGDPAPG